MNREFLLELKLKGYQSPRLNKDGKGNWEKGNKKDNQKGKGKGGDRKKEKKLGFHPWRRAEISSANLERRTKLLASMAQKTSSKNKWVGIALVCSLH